MANTLDSSVGFYRSLDPVSSFDQVLDSKLYRPVPDDWVVAITDVVNSTLAIEDGRYKEVNAAGAVAAVAIGNELGSLEFPFSFGGDGMFYLLPGSLAERVRDILADTRSVVRSAYGLELRAGIVPMADVRAAGHEIRVSKLAVTERYVQAIIDGDGVDFAESRVKHASLGKQYRIPDEHTVKKGANFEGFTCRWQGIPTEKDEIVSIIVKPIGDGDEERRETVRRAMEEITGTLGTEQEYRPLTVASHDLSTYGDPAGVEAAFHSRGRSGIVWLFNRFRIWFESTVFKFVVSHKLPVKVEGKNIGQAREDNIMHSDFRKYDGTLKLVASTTYAAREKLEAALDVLEREGKIVYGLHRSDRALLTCLVRRPSVGEVHFVDAADGGYALAARSLKAKLVRAQ
ncbi:MAG: DUF3095 domain-containing protein [Spirochaetales bacterium]|nr:DUF3095 domain-containing protein [Spirochaetales bacterium]